MSELARINTNVAALRAYLVLSQINDKITKAAELISTGQKIKLTALGIEIDNAGKLQSRHKRSLGSCAIETKHGKNICEIETNGFHFYLNFLFFRFFLLFGALLC